MAAPEMTSTKIDKESRRKLELLAARSDRKPPAELALIIDQAFRTSPAELDENAVLATMMDDIVDKIEAGEVTDAAIANAEAAREAGVISWGSEDGTVIGTMIDGTRVDVSGNVLTH
jgi:hypothetical protein